MHPSAKQPRGVPMTAKMIGKEFTSLLVQGPWSRQLQQAQHSQRYHKP